MKTVNYLIIKPIGATLTHSGRDLPKVKVIPPFNRQGTYVQPRTPAGLGQSRLPQQMFPVHHSAIPLKGLRQLSLADRVIDEKSLLSSGGIDRFYNKSVTPEGDFTKAVGKPNGAGNGEGLPSLGAGKFIGIGRSNSGQETPEVETIAANEKMNSFRVSKSKSHKNVGFQKKGTPSEKSIGNSKGKVKDKNARFEEGSGPTRSSDNLNAFPGRRK